MGLASPDSLAVDASDAPINASPDPIPARRRRIGLALVTLSVLLAGCGGDDTAQDVDDTVDSDEPATDTDTGTAGTADDVAAEAAEGPSQVYVQFRGEDFLVTGDDENFSCLTVGGDESVSFGIIDDAGNDVSVQYSGGDSASATAILADGTTWDRTDGGVLNVTEGPDGAIRMSIQMTERDTDQSESMDVRLTCS